MFKLRTVLNNAGKSIFSIISASTMNIKTECVKISKLVIIYSWDDLNPNNLRRYMNAR